MFGAAGRLVTGLQRVPLSAAPFRRRALGTATGSGILTRGGNARSSALPLGVVLTAAFSSAAALSSGSAGTCEAAAASMRKDANGLWWRGEGSEADGPYVLKSEGPSAPPLSPLSRTGQPELGTLDGTEDFKRIPFTVDEILPLARELAISCNVAALSTVSEETPGQFFPRSRSVSTRHYINKDFTETSIATKLFTRKVAELRANPNFSLLWKYESDEKKTTGGWILAMGQAEVIPHANAGKGPEVEGFDKAKVVFTINRLEIQDYPNHILAFGHDKWRCCILERQGGQWVKVR